MANIGLAELTRRRIQAAVGSFITAYREKHHDNSPSTRSVEAFIRSKLAPGESIRSDTLGNIINAVREAQRIAKLIQSGRRADPLTYPFITDVTGCEGYVYKTIWEIDFPSETDPGESRRIRVPIEVHSDRPLSRAEIARDSAIAATDQADKVGKYKTLQLGLEYNTYNPVYIGIATAYRC